MVKALHLRGNDKIDLGDTTKPITRNLNFAPVTFGAVPDLMARVAVEMVGVCGSNLSAALAKPNFSFVRRDLTPQGVMDGHEGGGVFEGYGPHLLPYKNINPGDRVLAVAMTGCGICRGCLSGCPNLCRGKQILGFHEHGLMSPICDLNPERLIKVDPALTALQVAHLEPLSVLENLLERLIPALMARGPLCNLDVIVSGPGIIGFMIAELLKAMGVRVAVCGVEADRASRLSKAEARGMHTIVVGGTNGTLQDQLAAGMTHGIDGGRFGDPLEDGCVDALIECSGAPSALASAPLCVSNAGVIGLVATYPVPVDKFEATVVVRGQQMLVPTMGSAPRHYLQAMLSMLRGKFDPTPYAVVFPASQAVEAYEAGMRLTVCKPVIDWASKG